MSDHDGEGEAQQQQQFQSLVQRRRSELTQRFSMVATSSNRPAVVLDDGIVTDRTNELKRRFSMKDAVTHVVHTNRLAQDYFWRVKSNNNDTMPPELTVMSEHTKTPVRAPFHTSSRLSISEHGSSRSSVSGKQEQPGAPQQMMISKDKDKENDKLFQGLDRYMALMSPKEGEQLQQVMKPPPQLSFTDTYIALGGGTDCRTTGRGSIFVMADPKLAKTRVIQRRLGKAAQIIQRFFGYAKHIMKFHAQELDYWRQALADAKRRHKAELKDVRIYIELEKNRIAVEIEQELGQIQDVLREKQQTIVECRQELKAVKVERQDMYDKMRKLTLENMQCNEQMEDPVVAHQRKVLEEHVGFLKFRNVTYKAMFDECLVVNVEYDHRLKMATTQARLEATIKDITRKCVDEILKRMTAGCDDDNLVNKIQKKRDKLAQKIAERAAQEAEEAAQMQREQAAKDKLRGEILQLELLQREEAEKEKTKAEATRQSHAARKKKSFNLATDRPPFIVDSEDEKEDADKLARYQAESAARVAALLASKNLVKVESRNETPENGISASLAWADGGSFRNGDDNKVDSGTDESPRSAEDELNLNLNDESMQDRSERRRERKSMKDRSARRSERKSMKDTSMTDESMKDRSERRRERKSMKDTSMHDESMKERSERRRERKSMKETSMNDERTRLNENMKDESIRFTESTTKLDAIGKDAAKKKKNRSASLLGSSLHSANSDSSNNVSLSFLSLLESDSAHVDKKMEGRNSSVKSPKKKSTRRATLKPDHLGESTALLSLIQGDVVPPKKKMDASLDDSSAWSRVLGEPESVEKKGKKSQRTTTSDFDPTASMAFFSLVDCAVEASRNRRGDVISAPADVQTKKPVKLAMNSNWNMVKSQKASLAAMAKMGASSPLLDLISGSVHG
jgi:hypothetical protein